MLIEKKQLIKIIILIYLFIMFQYVVAIMRPPKIITKTITNINQTNGIKISDAILLNLALQNSRHNRTDFYFIAGNHDGEPDGGIAEIVWTELIQLEARYIIEKGNLQIMMESVDLRTNSECSDNWIKNNIDDSKNVIVCRHYNDKPEISESIFLFLHGHNHFHHNDTNRTYTFGNGEITMDISGIDCCHSGDSSHSYLFTFISNSNEVVVSDFNHTSSIWMDNVSLHMPYIFEYEKNVLRIIFCSDFHIGNIECGLLNNFNIVSKCIDDLNSFPDWELCLVLGDISDSYSLYYLLDKT